MRLPLVSALVLLGACQREPAPAAEAPPAEAPRESASIPATPAAAVVEGWRTDQAAYPLLGARIPAFKAPLNGGGEFNSESLRNRWTVLCFWGLWSDDSLADARYIAALVSAIGQDPDLDFMSVHIPPALGKGDVALGAFRSLDAWFADQSMKWPTAIDQNGEISEAFRLTGAPIYLLVGPDLTIEGWRSDLSATPDDGIKSTIRGVAAIRKQVAAPQ